MRDKSFSKKQVNLLNDISRKMTERNECLLVNLYYGDIVSEFGEDT